MSGPWDDYQAQAQDASSPWQDYKPQKEGPAEAAISGLAHGLTFGLSDKIIASTQAALDSARGQGDYSDLYDKYLNQMQTRSKSLQTDNPKSYTAGSLGGAVVSPINKIIPGGPITSGIGAGAIMGAGESQAHPTESYDDLKQFGSDVSKGAAYGAAGGAIAAGAGQAASAFAPKKVLSVMLGAPEQAVERYIENPEAVQNAASLPETVDKVKNQVAALKDTVTQGSKQSREFLTPEAGSQFTGSQIAQAFQNKIGDIQKASEGALSPTDTATIKYLEQQAAPFISGENGDKIFSGNRVKNIIQGIDQQTKAGYGLNPGEFAKPDDITLMGVRKDLDSMLKENNPGYTEMMQGQAAKTGLLNDVQGTFRSDQGLANTLNRVRRDRAPFSEEIFNRLDQEFGTTTTEDIRDALAKEAFDKGSAGPGGSRNVNMYRSIISDWAEKNKIPFGQAMGAVLGGTIDKYGPGMAKSGIDIYKNVTQNPYTQGLMQTGQNAIQGLGIEPQLSPAVTQYLIDKFQK